MNSLYIWRTISFLEKNHYKESTLTKYRRGLNVLKSFCKNHDSKEYTL